MRASNWEFTNRAMLFGLVYAVSFPLSAVDPQNAAVALANVLGGDADRTARLLFFAGALLLVCAALLRTWASAYLHASVVYAANVKTATLVADGPYRHLRNPLYFANILMAVGMGALMSRAGFVVAVGATAIICYRLIFREEFDLAGSQGESYARYLSAVPRLFPSLTPRIASAGSVPRWGAGFRAELWCWGFAAASTAFAATLSIKVFFAILIPSMMLLWLGSATSGKR